MDRGELIKKWLDNSLSPEEQNAFEQLDDYKDLIKMNSALKDFRAPDFSIDNNYQQIKPQLNYNEAKTKSWFKPLMRIAAVLAIGFCVYYYTTTIDTSFNTNVAQQTTIKLPDASIVAINSNSILTFNKNDWNNNREVRLVGEAFFKVEKGQKFDVITETGTISVLGTKFNVKQRESYFEVTCYEGLVAVTYNSKTTNLKPGHVFRVIDGQLANNKESSLQPNWLRGESSFKSIPLKHVIYEFENQYDLKITTDAIDTSRLFTGSFTHKNLDLALKSITIPLNLSYIKSGKTILLKRE